MSRLTRRHMIAALGAAALAQGTLDASALPLRRLEFPRDHGAHPEQRTEWWYVTGHATAGTGVAQRAFGFQVTFFRSRVDGTEGIASAFAARQLVFAHAAVTDLENGKLLHDQRIAREGFGIAGASIDDGEIRLRDWSLIREDIAAKAGAKPGDRWKAIVRAQDFAFDLTFDSTQPLLLQGRAGLSRKGPDEKQASYYYSQPQLAVSGTLALRAKNNEAGSAKASAAMTGLAIQGKAWLDHEWSEELLHPDAVGWDWIGMNLDDGSALTAFRLRSASGGTVWAGGSFRRAANAGDVRVFTPGEVSFTPLRFWTSPVSRTRYPVEWTVRTPAGSFTVRALLDDQELDSRSSTGAIYWEGVSDLIDAAGRRVGRGYLEMTGYAGKLRL